MKNTKKEAGKPVYNPFDGRHPEEVWTEIRKNKGPRVSREEAMRSMEALTKKKIKRQWVPSYEIRKISSC